MRKILWIFIFCLVLLTMVIWPCGGTQLSDEEEENEPYDYPIRPGTDEWKALASHADMIQACQIPEDILKNMTTEALLETVLDYPLYWDMRAYNSIQQGFDAVAARFNGLQELLNREDTGAALLAKYVMMNPAAIEEDWTSVQKGTYVWGIADIEILLAQEAVIGNLTEEQLQDLIEETIVKSEAKQKHSDIYGYYGQESTALIIARALHHANYSPFQQAIQNDNEFRLFLENGSFSNESMLNEMFSQANLFLSEG